MGQKIYESDKFLKTGGTSSQYLMADGSTSTGPDTGVDVGTGTANKVAKFSDSDTITDSTITDDGTDVSITGNLGIGTTPSEKLEIALSGSGTSREKVLISSASAGQPGSGYPMLELNQTVSSGNTSLIEAYTGSTKRFSLDNDGDLYASGSVAAGSLIMAYSTTESTITNVANEGIKFKSTHNDPTRANITMGFGGWDSTERVVGLSKDRDDLLIRRNLDGNSTYSSEGSLLRLEKNVINTTSEDVNIIEWADDTLGELGVITGDGNVGIGTTSPDSPIHISETDTNYDVARGVHVEITKDHTNTTGWGASLFGVRSTVQNDGVGKLTDLQAGRFQAEHIGTGVSYYLLGSQSKGTHNGSGNTGVIWGAFNAGQVFGTGTGTHPYLIGTNQKAELDNANASVGNMAGIISAAKTTAGDVTGRIDGAWIELDCNQGAATTVDANVLYLKAQTGNLTASGTIRTIHSTSTHPSEFAGTIEATEFIVTGATSQRFLKGDGSLDSTTYNSGAGTSGGVAIYDGTNTTTDDANLQWNFPSSKLTITGDLDVTADIQVDNITVTSKVEAGSFAVDALNTAPSTASSTGTLGEIRVTSDYIYVCVATDTWKRTSLTTWGFTP